MILIILDIYQFLVRKNVFQDPRNINNYTETLSGSQEKIASIHIRHFVKKNKNRYDFLTARFLLLVSVLSI